MSETLHIGVLRVDLAFPGARSLKDRRRGLVSLQDSVRSRFKVSCHQLEGPDVPSRASLVVTTAATRADVVDSVLEKVQSFVGSKGGYLVAGMRSEVIPWTGLYEARWADDEVADE